MAGWKSLRIGGAATCVCIGCTILAFLVGTDAGYGDTIELSSSPVRRRPEASNVLGMSLGEKTLLQNEATPVVKTTTPRAEQLDTGQRQPQQLQHRGLQPLPHAAELKSCPKRSTSRDTSAGRCIFIDTDGSRGNFVKEFQTYTVFGATRCAWEVWHFGSLSLARGPTFRRLKVIQGVTVRNFRYSARAPPSGQLHVNLNITDQNVTDLAGLMVTNLSEDDYITVGLHDDVKKNGENQTLLLAQALRQVGVAAWVDKWLIHTGFLHHYKVSKELRTVLLQGVPGLEIPGHRNDMWKLVHAAHAVTHMAFRADAKAAAKQALLFAPAREERRIFLDFGTNHGDTIYQFLTFVPDPQNWELWGFEALKDMAELASGLCQWLIANYPLGPNRESAFHILNCAVWTEDTQLEFHTGDYNAGSVYDKAKATGPVVQVPALDIAKWMRSHFQESDNIYVKMDIEGAEYPVIEHMKADGVACWPRNWALEWHNVGKDKAVGGAVRREGRKNMSILLKETGAEVGELE